MYLYLHINFKQTKKTNIMTTIQNLPAIQTKFINQFDGTLESVIKFEELSSVLNPCFTSHYFFISGTCDEDTITTKHTNGSTAYNGNQTEEQVKNSYKLAKELREFILSNNPTSLEKLTNFNIDAMKKFGKKVSSIRKNACFMINNEIILVKGLKLN